MGLYAAAMCGFAAPTAAASQLESLAMAEAPPAAAAAAPTPTKSAAAPEARALAARFEAHGYDWDSVLTGDPVPDFTVRTLPKDLARLRDVELKKSLFFRALLPATLQVNRDIEVDRERLLDVKAKRDRGVALDAIDRAWLSALAVDYGGDLSDLGDLALRVDGVPPSLVLAQAAEESGWGTSRFVREGNALFGQYTWSDDHDGIVPAEANDGNRRVRAFASVKGAVAAYIHNLNSHSAYERFRLRRASGASGYELAASLKNYSVRGEDYVDTLRIIMRANNLSAVDEAELSDEIQISRFP